MNRVEELRSEAVDLYEFAGTIPNGDDRLAVLLRALVCESEAEAIERGNNRLPPFSMFSAPKP
jgi:hypothetical protein